MIHITDKDDFLIIVMRDHLGIIVYDLSVVSHHS